VHLLQEKEEEGSPLAQLARRAHHLHSPLTQLREREREREKKKRKRKKREREQEQETLGRKSQCLHSARVLAQQRSHLLLLPEEEEASPLAQLAGRAERLHSAQVLVQQRAHLLQEKEEEGSLSAQLARRAQRAAGAQSAAQRLHSPLEFHLQRQRTGRLLVLVLGFLWTVNTIYVSAVCCLAAQRFAQDFCKRATFSVMSMVLMCVE